MPEPTITANVPKTQEVQEAKDDMYDYNICFTRYGLLCLEFYDAVREGDGESIFRCWKFLLLHFRCNEGGSTKYALEALYLILQVKSLLSPRQAQIIVESLCTWKEFKHSLRLGP